MITSSAVRTPSAERAGVSRLQPSFRLVESLDPGLAAVRLAHDTLGLDAPWSLREGRGFTSRASGLTQRVWSEPGHVDGVVTRYRLHAEIDVVRELADPAGALATANTLNGLGSLGVLVVDPLRGRVTQRVSAWVDAGSLERVAPLFAMAVALGVSESARVAQLLAHAGRGTIDRSQHPGASARIHDEDRLDFDRLAAAAGRDPSRWADGSLLTASDELGQSMTARRVVASDHAFSMPIPFGADVAYLQATTTEAHPILGHGLTVRLSLPVDATERADPATAAELNRLELGSWSRTHLLGAWVASSDRIDHLTFYPNLAHRGDADTLDILRCDIRRAYWAAGVLG